MNNKQFAIIKTGGKQYRVSKGQELKVEKLPNKEGGNIQFKDVLLYRDGKTVEVGTPRVKSAKVTGEIVEHGKRDKVMVYKFKKRKRHRKKKGHRQPYTKVKITDIKKESTQKSASTTKKKQATQKTSAKTKQTKTTKTAQPTKS